MKLTIDHDEGTIDVALDSGEVIGRYCVIENQQTERADFRRMLEAVAQEAAAAERAKLCTAVEEHLDSAIDGTRDFWEGRAYAVAAIREAL